MIAIITGASKGIGFELVKRFSQDKNYMVIAISRNIEPLKKLVQTSTQHNVLPIKADITKTKDLAQVIKVIHKLNTPVDVMINKAGIIVNKPFEKISEKELIEVYKTNVFAPFNFIHLLIPNLSQSKNPHIVNISSMGGFQGSAKFSGLSAYSSSKSALAGLTECLAEELKSKKISVNCLAIGAVQTEMLTKAFPGYKAPLKANQMAAYIYDFAINGRLYFNGKIIPVSSTTP